MANKNGGNKNSYNTKGKSKSSNVKVSRAENKPVTKPMIGASLARIKPMTVETGWLTRVTIVGDGIIDLTHSWADFILTLLGAVYNKDKERFMCILADNHVLSDGINLNTKYIEYPETSGIDCEVYKLSNSPYYIEFRKDGIDYVRAIKGLLTALKVDIKDVTFDIEPMTIKVNGINTTFNEVKQVIMCETLDELMKKNKLNIDVISITVFGYKQKVKSTTQALMMFMTWALASYGNTLETAGVKNSLDGVGMTTSVHIDEYSVGFTTLKLGEHYLYCCDDNMSMIKYMSMVAEHIGIPLLLIELEYKTLELTK